MADHRGEGRAARETEPDSYENLDLSFDDLPMVEDLLETNDPSVVKKPSQGAPPTKDDVVKGGCSDNDGPSDYILGTLVVRVVAARDLESVGPSGLGKLFFGSDNRSSRQSSGYANPYAVVRFVHTTQRTSEVFDTVDPIWPRGETMYMDVVHRSGVSSTLTASSEPSVAKASKKAPPDLASKKPTKLSSSASSSGPLSEQEQPILTVAIFHASEIGKIHKNFSKTPMSGDSNDRFLGMTAVDLTHLLTGKVRMFDEWLPLSGSNSDRAAVRIVCEYEPSDGEPHPGDLVRFTNFCAAVDLFPLHLGKLYNVEECDGDDVLISCTSQEGWVSTFLAHRYMLICEARHLGAVEIYQDELASIKQRIAHSPLVSVVQETVNRVPEDGLIGVGVDAFRGGASLLTRWMQGGIGTAVDDIAMATNWDGRFNPDASRTLSTTFLDPDQEEVNMSSQESTRSSESSEIEDTSVEPLPNMPSCPITGEPMRDPVVAADGHTYERNAIARWLKTSDKSPLTGSILQHKNLVPNYMLLSSLQEAAAEQPAVLKKAKAASEIKMDEDDATTEVNIDD